MAARQTKVRNPAPTQSTMSFAESYATWLDEISILLDDHYSGLMTKGRGYVARISGMKYLPDEFCIECQCQGSQRQPYTVTIAIEPDPHDPELYLQTYCTCPYSMDEVECEHTYAAALVLQREFQRGVASPLVKSLLGTGEPPWATALRKLDQVLTRTPPGDFDDAVAPKAKARLVWRVSVNESQASYHGSPLLIEPVEQAPGKRGGWNKGRGLAWDRVTHRPELDVQSGDLKVLRAARVDYYGGHPHGDTWGAVFESLVGHPRVMFENDFLLNVRRGQLGVSVQDRDDGWQLVPTLDGVPIKEFSVAALVSTVYVMAIDAVKHELIVGKGTRELADLVTALTQEDAIIPAEAQPEFAKRLPALEAIMPVGLPASMKGELIDADCHLVLRIHPTDPTGARIELRVTPAPEGATFVPGQGPEEAAGKRDDQRVRVLRDLDDERQRATMLRSELFLDRFSTPEPFSWQIGSDDEVLDLLDSLRARAEHDPIVVWPEGTHVRRMHVLGEIAPSAMKVEIKDQHDWFGLSGTIELGGQKFPLAMLLAALREGRRYVSLGQGQFATIAQEFRARLASVSDMLHANRGKLEFNATAAPVIADLLDQQMSLKVSKKWKESLSRLNRATDLDPQIPTTLTAELRDYQVDGFKWLRRLSEWGVGGILADDMGLGKTVQALAVLLDRREAGPILVVAPVSVGFNWMRETDRFAPTLRPILYRDTDRAEFLTTLGPGDLLITSYYLMQQHAEDLSKIKWGTLVLDEAQNIKNSQTKTAQVVRSLDADWRLALTGTPCENHLGDLWSVFRGVSPGLFGSWERFREVFADPIEKGKVANRKQALARVLRPFVLRRTKSEVLTELPPRTEVQLMAELSDAERRRYEDARLWAVTHLTDLADDTGQEQRFQVLAALTKLRQLACHPRLVDQAWDKSSAKLDLFLETVDELREGKHRALVFSQFTSHLALIKEALDERKITYQYLDGKTTAKQRQERVDAFQRGEGEFFLISLKAGGTGLNLTGADYVIHMDPWWNPAVEDQASDRAHRIGQTRPVTVYRLVAKDTIEEQILKLHGEKRNLVAGVLEGTDQAGKLSTHELIDLIKLGGRQT